MVDFLFSGLFYKLFHKKKKKNTRNLKKKKKKKNKTKFLKNPSINLKNFLQKSSNCYFQYNPIVPKTPKLNFAFHKRVDGQVHIQALSVPDSKYPYCMSNDRLLIFRDSYKQ